MRTLILVLLAGCGPKAETPPAPQPEPEPEPEVVAAPAPEGPGDCDLPVTDEETTQALEAALAAEHRKPENRARDPQRHPLETLTFFGLQEDMTVVELWPGGGWYTEILAPVLAEEGKLVVTNFDPEGPEDLNLTRYGKRMQEKLTSNPELFGGVDVRIVRPPESIELGEAGSADLVLTFRNNHGWLSGGYHDKVYEAAFDVLKPCGVLGVVQHRAAPGTDPATAGDIGYVAEEVVIEAAEEAGFVLAGRSEVNANPRDTKDHPEGVWTLPPSYRLEEQDRAKYEAIGESDRMTLRFVKPAQ